MQRIDPVIVFQDAFIIAINKPAGMLSIPDRFDTGKPNIHSWLKKQYPTAMVLHRLDRETSGLMIFALDEESHRRFSGLFHDRLIKKEYLALVDGVMIDDSGEVDAPIAESKTTAGTMVISGRGKKSRTSYQVLERFKNCTLIAAEIHTGRMHQVRVHMRHIGHPLLIDAIYGERDHITIEQIKRKNLRLGKWVEEAPSLMSRSTLHSFRLSFEHPLTDQMISIEAPLHKDFNAVLSQLRKWSAQK